MILKAHNEIEVIGRNHKQKQKQTNMKTYKLLWKYGITRRLKRGATISISPTFRCNYNCEYCSPVLGREKRKILPEVTLEKWLHFIDHFPIKLREVNISGGEPTIMDYFPELVNELLKRNLNVSIFTNLSNNKLFECIPSARLRIDASFHHSQANGDVLFSRVQRLKKGGYQITVNEIGESWTDYKTDVKAKIVDVEETKIYTMLRVAPDLSIHISCYDLFN